MARSLCCQYWQWGTGVAPFYLQTLDRDHNGESLDSRKGRSCGSRRQEKGGNHTHIG